MSPIRSPRPSKIKISPLSSDLTEIRDQAILAAVAAGAVLMKHYRRPLKIREKKDAGLVTQADIQAQDKCVSILRKKFSHFGFLTEEAPPEKGSSSGRWIIDPLDGTNNFIHGYPMFCVSIAAEWEGKLAVGVIYHPIFKDLYVAVLGSGAYLNGRRIFVSQPKKLQDALLTTGFTTGLNPSLRSEMRMFKSLSQKCRAIRRPGSAALDLAYVAQGVFDGFWEQGLSAWDIAAGILIVREAGGIVSDFKGKTPDLNKGSVVASSKSLHPLLLKSLKI